MAFIHLLIHLFIFKQGSVGLSSSLTELIDLSLVTKTICSTVQYVCVCVWRLDPFFFVFPAPLAHLWHCFFTAFK